VTGPRLLWHAGTGNGTPVVQPTAHNQPVSDSAVYSHIPFKTRSSWNQGLPARDAVPLVSFPAFKNNVAQCRHYRPPETLSRQQSRCGLVSETGATCTPVMLQPVKQSTVIVRRTDV